LLLQYREIYRRKSTASDESLAKLKGGLAKLAEAEISVDTIQKEVTEKKVQMEEKQKEADQALIKIREKMEESTEQKKNINKIRKELDADRLVIQEKSAVVEARLSTIQPTLDAAKEAIGAIQPSQLHEVRSMTKPPAAVQDVLEGVLTIMGEKDISWAAIKRFLLDTGLKKRFQEMDPTSLTRETRANVQKILDAKGNSFKEEVISRASRAAAPMAAWLKATIEYNAVFEQVEPMHREMDEYKKSMQKNEERMQRYEEKLKKLEGKVEDLRNNFEKTTKEGMRLKDRLEKAEGTLVAAQELLAKLSAEKGRWGEQAAAIQRDMSLVPKRALVAAAFMTYLGPRAGGCAPPPDAGVDGRAEDRRLPVLHLPPHREHDAAVQGAGPAQRRAFHGQLDHHPRPDSHPAHRRPRRPGGRVAEEQLEGARGRRRGVHAGRRPLHEHPRAVGALRQDAAHHRGGPHRARPVPAAAPRVPQRRRKARCGHRRQTSGRRRHVPAVPCDALHGPAPDA
jgi:predicted  nucleic acid-binding Zn-ribbon protein